MHCDCGATWLIQLSNVTTLLLPLCQTPEHRRGNTLAAIADDCNEGECKKKSIDAVYSL